MTTVDAQRLKVDSMAEVEITTGTLTPYQYTITYNLYQDGVSIAEVTVEKAQDNVPLTTRVLGEVPNLTWISTPSPGSHIFEVRIRVTGTNIASAVALTRALNIISF